MLSKNAVSSNRTTLIQCRYDFSLCFTAALFSLGDRFTTDESSTYDPVSKAISHSFVSSSRAFERDKSFALKQFSSTYYAWPHT